VELIDIPTQLSKAYAYSGRSWKAFVLSISFGILATGVVFDLAYGFFYERMYNVDHVHYGSFYWAMLAGVSLLVPLALAAASLAWWRFQARPFRGDKFGIAIAPFEVLSLHVDNMATSDKLLALDEVVQQFFAVIQQVLHEEKWAPDFEFRVLPSNVRVRDEHEAASRFKSLEATLLISGQVIQEDTLNLTMRLTGVEMNLLFTGRCSPTYLSLPLKFYSLLAAVMALEQKGRLQEADKYLDLALEPARQLDAHATGAIHGQAGSSEKLVEYARGRLHPEQKPGEDAKAS
jgi:hypothetical protein